MAHYSYVKPRNEQNLGIDNLAAVAAAKFKTFKLTLPFTGAHENPISDRYEQEDRVLVLNQAVAFLRPRFCAGLRPRPILVASSLRIAA